MASAKSDILKIADYYKIHRSGLDNEFGEEFEKTIDRIIKQPFAWRLISQNTRRCNMIRFPYAIIYEVINSQILIYAIMHEKQHPDSWKSRQKK
ncbi:type II toxin-antitoxin system RelE/ParE family toxin [candidate division KSB1 bacterium]|nr:type II toxin-antitoxin system RelE/ParE family toxin [candidate division KSB1 bacterium]